MRNATSIWLLLPVLFLLHVVVAERIQAQPQPTTAEEFQIRNQLGQEVGLTLPSAGVSPYSVLFPTTAPGTGDLFFSTNGSGQMSWLTPGTNGSALVLTGGLPTWGRLNPGALNLSQNALFVGNASNVAAELPSIANRILITNGSGLPGWRTTLPNGITVSFRQLTTGTNNVATMRVGTGAILLPTGTGIVTSNRFVGSGSTTINVDLATPEVAGTLPIARGGTNATATPTAGAVAYGTGSAYAFTAVGSSGNVLVSNGAAAPSFQNPNSLFWRLSGNSGTNPATNFLGTTDNQRVVFRTNNVERMTISTSGHVGLGTSAPGGIITIVNDDVSDVTDDVIFQTYSDNFTPLLRLSRARGSQAVPSPLLNNDITGLIGFHDATGLLGAQIRAVADANHGAFDQSTRLEFRTTNGLTQSTQMTIDDNGNVGIGITAPTQALHVVGNAGKTVGGTTWVNLSDERTKDVQGNYTKGLSDILDLRPVVFRYKANNPWGAASDVDQYGYIAQEVETVFPEAVETGDDGYLVFNMHPILVAYTNAVKELSDEIDDRKEAELHLQAQINELKELIESLHE